MRRLGQGTPQGCRPRCVFGPCYFPASGLLGYAASGRILLILLAYGVLNLAYSLRLKEIVILDVFCIAAGFMLRILAGTSGVGIRPSEWLLLCGLMLTLFLGFAKRRAEMARDVLEKAEELPRRLDEALRAR